MFLFKKIITACLLPPGCLIILLFVGAICVRKRLRLFVVCLAVFAYLISIEPTKHLLLAPLESGYPPPSVDQIENADAYVLLGAGVRDEAPDIDGKGTLTEGALFRLHTAYRLYQIRKKPIIASGGAVLGRTPEAQIAQRTLVRLGARADDVIAETKSQDTMENARFTAELCREKGIKRIVLVTDAYHMRRSMFLFHTFFDDITACPATYLSPHRPYGAFSLIPSAENMLDLSYAVKEYIGIVYYRLVAGWIKA
jgi:uncharacterized SAM-binding protein YcdF (DUF218 family)